MKKKERSYSVDFKQEAVRRMVFEGIGEVTPIENPVSAVYPQGPGSGF
jgi:hypothetical protein